MYTKENTPARGAFSWNSDKSVSGIFAVNHLTDSIANKNNLSSAAQMDGTGLEPAFPQVVNRGAYQLAEPPKGAANNIISRFSAQGGPASGWEVIVVDNASSDSTVEMVRQNFPQVRLIVNQENKGFSAANNQGIKEAKGEYILLLNPDTEFIENSLERIIAKMQSDEKIGVLGCRLLNADKTTQPSVRRFPSVWSQLAILFKLHKIFPGLLNYYLAKDFDYDHPLTPSLVKEGEVQEVDQVMGAFFCVPKALFDKIGLLDEGYFIWFEEVDFCRRAKAAGYKVVYWPGTSVIHYGGQSFAQQMSLKKQWWFFRSAWRYLTKW